MGAVEEAGRKETFYDVKKIDGAPVGKHKTKERWTDDCVRTTPSARKIKAFFTLEFVFVSRPRAINIFL